MTDSDKNKRIMPSRPEGVSDSCLPEFYPCKLDEKSKTLAKYLVDLAKEDAITTYTKAGEQIDEKADSLDLRKRLGELSWVTYVNEGVFLSVIVTKKEEETEKKIPGKGFFSLVAAFHKTPYPPISTHYKLFITERDRVYKTAKSENDKAGKLDFILTGETFND